MTFTTDLPNGLVYVDQIPYSISGNYLVDRDGTQRFVSYGMFTRKRTHITSCKIDDEAIYLTAIIPIADAVQLIKCACSLFKDVVNFVDVEQVEDLTSSDAITVFSESLKDAVHSLQTEGDSITMDKAYELFKVLGTLLDNKKSLNVSGTLNSNFHRETVHGTDIAELLYAINHVIEEYTCYRNIEYCPTSSYVNFLCIYINMYMCLKSRLASEEPQTIEMITMNAIAAGCVDMCTDRHFYELYIRPKNEGRAPNSYLANIIESIARKLPIMKPTNIEESINLMHQATRDDKISTLLTECPVQISPWIFTLNLSDDARMAFTFDTVIKAGLPDMMKINNGAEWVRLVMRPLIESCVKSNGYYGIETCLDLLFKSVDINKFIVSK